MALIKCWLMHRSNDILKNRFWSQGGLKYVDGSRLETWRIWSKWTARMVGSGQFGFSLSLRISLRQSISCIQNPPDSRLWIYLLIGLNWSLNLEKTPTPPLTKPPTPTAPHQGTNFFSAKSCWIFIKHLGYLPNNLPTWSMMSNVTPQSKSPIRNPQCPKAPNLGFLSQIISNLDQMFGIGPLATTNIIFDV